MLVWWTHRKTTWLWLNYVIAERKTPKRSWGRDTYKACGGDCVALLSLWYPDPLARAPFICSWRTWGRECNGMVPIEAGLKKELLLSRLPLCKKKNIFSLYIYRITLRMVALIQKEKIDLEICLLPEEQTQLSSAGSGSSSAEICSYTNTTDLLWNELLKALRLGIILLGWLCRKNQMN